QGGLGAMQFVAPASCRQSRGHLALAAAGEDARRTAAETAALPGEADRSVRPTRPLLVRGQSWSFPRSFLLRFRERDGNVIERRDVLVDVGFGMLHRHCPLLVL